ncbi:MAG: hypothetical protein ABIR53_02355 [Paraperlucidibaca sp.]
MNVWTNLAAITVGLSVLVSGPALAKKYDAEEHSGKHSSAYENHKDHDERDHDREKKHDKKQDSNYFNQDRAQKINSYYSEKAKKSKHCPPGLAKKNNGCKPPGQVKKWEKGQPLAADVVYYNVPNTLLNELGRTPVGEKIVRVGEDILLINAVTGLVIDVVESIFP